MVKVKLSVLISTHNHIFFKGLIVLSLFALTSCCVLTQPMPPTQQPDQATNAISAQGQTEPTLTPKIQSETHEVIEENTSEIKEEETSTPASPTEIETGSKEPTNTAEANLVVYGQVKISNRFSEDFFLSYDKTKWELGGQGWLKSTLAPRCFITQFGEQDGGGDWQEKFTFETINKTIGGVEFRIDQVILLATGVPEWSYVVFDTQGNTNTKALNFYTGPENYEDCLAAFWEMMELSRAHNFVQMTGEPEFTDQPSSTETEPVDLGQIKFDHPMSPGLFLTYDTAKWEIQMNYYLGSKQYPECRIADFGPLDAPPGEEGKHTYEEMTEFVGNIEYLLEKRIVKDTGIADAMKIYFEKNGNYWKYAFRLGFGTDNYDECVAAFWEVMELSQANNFSQVPSLEP